MKPYQHHENVFQKQSLQMLRNEAIKEIEQEEKKLQRDKLKEEREVFVKRAREKVKQNRIRARKIEKFFTYATGMIVFICVAFLIFR